MSASTAPHGSSLHTGNDGFVQLLRAEWDKFRTVPAWVVGAAVATLVIVLLSLFAASGSHVGMVYNGKPVVGGPSIPVGPGGVGVADSFYFVHRPLEGDGSITVRVTSLTGVTAASGNARVGGDLLATARPVLQPWAKAGLIVKQSTVRGSAYAAVMITGAHGVRLQSDYTHDVAGRTGTVSPATPRWLRLTRSGDAITAFESGDGTHWTRVGGARVTGLGSTVQAGLFVASPVSSRGENGSPSLATAAFDHLRLEGGWPRGVWNGGGVGGGPSSDYPLLDTGGFHESAGRFTVSGSGDIAPAVRGGLFGGSTIDKTLSGVFAGLIVVIVLATIFITSEYRRGLIRVTLAASPRRGRVLVAKAIVIGAVTFVAGLVAVAIAVPLGQHILRSNGNFFFPISSTTELRVMAGTAALLAVAAVFALAIAALVRRSAAAVCIAIAAIVLPYILATANVLPAGASAWLFRVTPAAAFAVQQSLHRYAQVSNGYTPTQGYYPLAPWAGFAVLCAYAGLALGLAALVLRRRDA
jgi:ABC-type transport system involved in multi-copper enzyme maturation permease subunit